MALTFSDMQQQLQRTLGDTSADSLDDIKKAINLIYREMCGMSPQHWVREQKTLSVVAGTESYALDASVRNVLRIRPPVDVAGKIRIVDIDTWNEVITDYDRVGTPVLVKVEDVDTGNAMKIYFHPIPEAGDAGTYVYDAECRPSDLSTDSDTPVFGSQWDAAILDGARYELYKQRGDDAKAATAQAAYVARLSQFAEANQLGADKKGA